jgi:hypothetical protein
MMVMMMVGWLVIDDRSVVDRVKKWMKTKEKVVDEINEDDNQQSNK